MEGYEPYPEKILPFIGNYSSSAEGWFLPAM
jgi:hypothetical protein